MTAPSPFEVAIDAASHGEAIAAGLKRRRDPQGSAAAVERASKRVGIVGEDLDGPEGPWTVATTRLAFRMKRPRLGRSGSDRYGGPATVERCRRGGGTGRA